MASARAYRATVQSIPASTWTDIVASGTRWNDGPMWAGANPSRLTTTASGLHVVGANVGFVGNGTGGRWCRIQANGAALLWVAGSAHAPDAVGDTNLSPVALVNATAGDYYTAGLYQTSGAALNTAAAGAPYAADLHLTRLDPSVVGCRAEAAVAQSIPHNVWTQVTLDTTMFDTGTPAMRSGSTLVAPSDGAYCLWAGAYLQSAAGIAAIYYHALLVNGLTWAISGPGSSTGSFTAWSTSATVALHAGDVVTASILQTSGAARLLDIAELRPFLAMARIGG